MANKIDKKILIVEDDEDFSYILQKKFVMEGFAIVTAKNGEDGVAVTIKEKPDLIFSDILMPKMDGVAMAKKIRELNISIPIIFLSNMKDIDATIGVQKSGEFDYLIKSDTRINDIIAKSKDKLGLI